MTDQASIGKKCGVRFAGMGLCLFPAVFAILFMGCQNLTRPADTCVLAGKVVDGETQQPIENIKFKLYKYDPDTKKSEEVLTSGRDGAFSTTVKPGTDVQTMWEEGINADMFLLDYKWLWKTDNLMSQFTVTQDKTDLVLKIKLRPSVKLAGKVKDTNGRDAANALVYSSFALPPAPTDSSGKFLLPAVVPADCEFELFIISADKQNNALVKRCSKTLFPQKVFSSLRF